MSSLLVFNRVYRLEIQSAVMLVFSAQLWTIAPWNHGVLHYRTYPPDCHSALIPDVHYIRLVRWFGEFWVLPEVRASLLIVPRSISCKTKTTRHPLATASVNFALRFHVVINTQPSRSFKLPLTFSLVRPPPPPPSTFPQSKYSIYRPCGWEGVGGVLRCVGDHILQEFTTLYLTRFRTYKIALPPQTKT